MEKGGDAAHIDSVLLGSVAPEKIKGNQDALTLKKLSKRDFDVIDAFDKTLELTFPAAGKDTILHFTGRIEPNKISKNPFQFPIANLFREIDGKSIFYKYKFGSQKTSLSSNTEPTEHEQPFFREFCFTGSGHPSGFTYGWVQNDDNNLYVQIDFTPDNTIDEDKDYAEVHVKTKEGLKSFKVSQLQKKWGSWDFTYTDKASYQHKVYKFKIPLKELDINSAEGKKELLLAFSAYGSATPESHNSAIAYDPDINRYLVVYEYTADDEVGPWDIRGQVINADGTPIGSPQTIYTSPTGHNRNPELAYDNSNQGFFVVWSHYAGPDEVQNIQGKWVTIDPAGISSSNPDFTVNCDRDFNQYFPAIAYNSTNQNFMVVWEDYRNNSTTGSDIYGHTINSCAGGPPCESEGERCFHFFGEEADQLISHGDPPYYQAYDQLLPAIAYDSVKNEFLVVWAYEFQGAGDEYIFGQFIDNYGNHIYGQNFPVSVDWWDDPPPVILNTSVAGKTIHRLRQL